MAKRKTVRALRTGFYEGHRRREGALFTVPADAHENWFVAVGPAAEDDAAPEQLMQVRAAPPATFVGTMDKLAKERSAREQELSKPLSEIAAPAGADDVLPSADGADLT